MRLVQFYDSKEQRRVGMAVEGGESLRLLFGVNSVYDMALEAARRNLGLADILNQRLSFQSEDYEAVIRERRLLPPLDHPDASHTLVSGTGLSHLGSAAARDSMHAKLQREESELTDSMKIFKWGMEGGKPAAGTIGVQPEWFYKGDGRCVVAPEQPLPLPAFALDGGDEVEIAGLYLIGDEGEVLRVGFALGNEFADHVMERQNYLYLAHSKLRPCCFGPELLVGELPKSVSGQARVLRDGKEVWSDSFLAGEDNMAHSIWNLEHHHFKYKEFRRPGDVHVHFFGAATGSFMAGFSAKVGDVFEISSPLFGRPLRNPLGTATEDYAPIAIRAL
jgi:hypothetical protein